MTCTIDSCKAKLELWNNKLMEGVLIHFSSAVSALINY
jgi:hypothetical protein